MDVNCTLSEAVLTETALGLVPAFTDILASCAGDFEAAERECLAAGHRVLARALGLALERRDGELCSSLCLATVFSTFWLPGSDNLAKEPPMSQISAFPSIKALSILLLVPLNSTSLPWWTTLSIIAEASLSSPRIVPHLLNSMLVVNTTLRFS